MDLLQTPFEDLLLHHSLNAAAGSLWAWLAVLTAAVGFWRIRAVGSRSVAPTITPIRAIEVPAQPAGPPIELPKPTEEGTGTPKARFTAYYSYEACNAVAGGEEEAEEGNEDDEEECDRICGDVNRDLTAPWEDEVCGMCVRRRWDLGWYRYQERTALNGSVVRFWAGDVATSPRGSRRLLEGYNGNCR